MKALQWRDSKKKKIRLIFFVLFLKKKFKLFIIVPSNCILTTVFLKVYQNKNKSIYRLRRPLFFIFYCGWPSFGLKQFRIVHDTSKEKEKKGN